jgi:4-hydroxythreonine-4-phosphate dehydrogenase
VKRIGITLGDPSGIGPEIVALAIAKADAATRNRLVVFCDRCILDRAFAQTVGERPPIDLSTVDRNILSPDQALPGNPSEPGARAQVGYLEAAAKALRSETIAAVVTAPISKAQARSAGFEFPGHTEFFESRLKAESSAMMFAGPSMKVVLATTHIPLSEVPTAISSERIVEVTRLAVDSLRRDFGIESPRVGVLALNPHAGEGGIMGDEEQTIISPAIEAARRELEVEIVGPLSADSAFRAPCDLFVAMYHDQALIPVKLLDFDQAVNVTLGLGAVRTSPDHGVAYDIAGTGRASPDSFIAALKLAIEMVDRPS